MELTTRRHEFHVLEPKSECNEVDPRAIVLGRDVRIDSQQLGRFIGTSIDEIDVDLLYLAGVVARIDRLIRRRLSQGWARRLHVHMPVFEPKRWSQHKIHAALCDSLGMLTGDSWSFAFEKRHPDQASPQLTLFSHANAHFSTMPYSGGLDSYCGLLEWNPSATDAGLLVHTRTGHHSHSLHGETLHEKALHHVNVPVHLPELGNHPEPTYRTRTFTYFIVAALGARLSRGEKIVVSENGQGSLGPSLVRFPGEHPYFSTHPLFTRKLALLLNLIWGDGPQVHFLHPFRFRTKGQSLLGLVQRGSAKNWKSAVSCSRNIPRTKGAGASRQCGACGGCLLRRVSLNTAGLAEFGSDPEGYFWADLAQDQLVARSTEADSNTTHLDRRIAVHAIVGLASLADHAALGRQSNQIRTLAEDLAAATGETVSMTTDGIQTLLSAHRQEWTSAINRLPRRSWVRKVAEDRI